MKKTPKQIYLDYAASTPVSLEVFKRMKPYFTEKYGNPGSLHTFGQEAMAAVDKSREIIANAIGAKFREIIFTGSATEANNLVLRGAVASGISRIIISSIEHESVLETARALKKNGIEVIELPVDKEGIVKVKALEAALGGKRPLVSIMYANNETGAVQPIAKISKVIHAAGGLFHTDAAQAMQFLICNADELGVDFMTISAHKIYGPKGIGALYIRGKKIQPLISGGGQEFGFRSGTENVPLIVGFAAAVEDIEKDKEKHSRRVAEMKDQLIRGLNKIHPRAQLNTPKNSLPNIVNIWLSGVSAQDLLIQLSLAGIAISAGSACTARSSQPSHVLTAMGLSLGRAKESIRISLGRPTTSAEIAQFLKTIKGI